MKFGGTSVGDAAAMRQAAAQVQRAHADPAPPQLVVVVSAMRGVTDMLIGAARSAAAGDHYAP